MSEIETLLKPFFAETRPRRGLPAQAYVEPGFWIAERGSVFVTNWVCVGFAHELETAGDAVPVTLAGHPLLLVRNMKARSEPSTTSAGTAA